MITAAINIATVVLGFFVILGAAYRVEDFADEVHRVVHAWRVAHGGRHRPAHDARHPLGSMRDWDSRAGWS